MKSTLRVATLLAVFLSANGIRAAVPSDSTQLVTEAPSILLVTFDTVRADRIGAYGHSSAVTPTLDGLAARGVLFESAVSPTPITLPSRFGLSQGFETYRGPILELEFRMREARRPANEVVDDAISWFEQLDSSERFFVWVHFYDPHRPLRERGSVGGKIKDPYDYAISSCDRELGRLLKFLDARNMAENLLTVVTADHGESNGEHGESTHGIFVYQSSMRVPLILSGGPLADLKDIRVDRAVTNTAIAPTLLSLAGLPSTEMPSVRLGPLLSMSGAGISVTDVEPLLLQSLTPYYSYRWRALRGVVWRDHKLVQGSTSELYALKDDPGESVDLSKRQADLVTDLSRALEKLVAEHAPLGWAASRSVRVDELELLASLGYGTHYTGEDPFDPTLPDPRERIGDIELVNEAETSFARWGEVSTRYATAWQRDQKGRQFLEKARALTLELQERNPRDPTVPYLLGAIESELRNYEAAIPLLEQAARDRPFDSVCRARLADTYAKVQRTDDAISEMQKALDLVPEQPAYHQILIGYSLDARRYVDALQWMDRYVGAMKAGSAEHRDAKSWVSEQQQRIPPDARRSAVDSTAIP